MVQVKPLYQKANAFVAFLYSVNPPVKWLSAVPAASLSQKHLLWWAHPQSEPARD